MNDVLHTIIDVLAGRRNLAPHEADALHEELTPGYTTPPPSADAVAAAQALLDRAAAVQVTQSEPGQVGIGNVADVQVTQAPEGSAS